MSNYYFKHTWTGENFTISINPDIKIHQLKNIIQYQVINNLRINNNNYKIIIIGQELEEFAQPIDINSMGCISSLNTNNFYVRPYGPPPQSFLDRRNINIQHNEIINRTRFNNLKIYYFKHTITGATFTININPNIKIYQLKNIIKNQVINNLRINNNYKIIIAGQQLGELAQPIDTNSIESIRSLNTDAFYVRPIDEITPESFLDGQVTERLNIYECGICYQEYELNLIWTSCHHYTNCCNECITRWRETCRVRNTQLTCPFCVQNII
jgi:hypothetical protein